MNVCKTVQAIRKKLYQGQITQIENQIDADLVQILNELMKDDDDDVKYYCRKAFIQNKAN